MPSNARAGLGGGRLPRRALLWRLPAATALLLLGAVLAIPGVPGPGLALIVLALLLLLPVSPGLRRKYARLRRAYPRLFRRFPRHGAGRLRRNEECREPPPAAEA